LIRGSVFLLLDNEKEIAAAQRTLSATMARSFWKSEIRDIGYPGGTNRNAKIRTDGLLWYWTGDLEGSDTAPRYLNWFGLYKDTGGLHITVEANPPHAGRDNRVAAFFARHVETRRVYLFHSGRIGGGTPGVGQKALLAWSRLDTHEVADSEGKTRTGIIVMPIEGNDAVRPAARFVSKIADFKAAVRRGEIGTPAFQKKIAEWKAYYAEGRGRRRAKVSHVIDYISRHGEVVDALRDWRKIKGLHGGSTIVKNVRMDMAVARGGKLIEVYEVKTTTLRNDIYAAIGQLLTHGRKTPEGRFIVLPNAGRIAADLGEALDLLKIKVLRFELNAKSAKILPLP
jgi:hypothetical protein